jgi:hypothetical protein
MDARAADYQLTSRIDVTSPDFIPEVNGPSGYRATAWNELEERRRRVDNALAIARYKARYPGEAEAINVLSARFYEYYAQLQLMRYELDYGRKEAALANYKAAQFILVGNIGNAERDAQGNSREKVLKDNNWARQGDVAFICAINCATGTQGQTVRLSFNASSNYEGLAANVHKLAEINLKKLSEIGGISSLNSLAVIITAGLVLLAVIILSIYYAVITHRVLNIGFLLAFVSGVVVAWLLVVNLNATTQDYDHLSEQNISAIKTVSNIQQLSADAGADISRLLLSPSSPGLDSTNSRLTEDVKQAFARDILLNAYENKRKQVELELNNLWTLASAPGERSELCRVFNNPGKSCSGNTFSWVRFTDEAKNIFDRFDKKLLAEAILINIIPKASSTTSSAREQYNQFSSSMESISLYNKTEFDKRACNAIGESQFGNSCNGAGGYLNQLQVIIWIAFPLLSIFVSLGVWAASREF